MTAAGVGLNVSGVRLSERERGALVAAMKAHHGAERRRHERHLLPQSFALLVRIQHPGGTAATLSVTARDLSVSGVGFFHTSYIHPGTPAVFIMKRLGGEAVSVPGAIMRCRHVSGRVHEVGAVFDAEVRVEEFCETGSHTPVPPPPDVDAIRAQLDVLVGDLRRMADEKAPISALVAKVGELALALAPGLSDAMHAAHAPAADAPPPSPHAADPVGG
jgi:hypothetical protein